jgi:hypothetical protein
MRRRKPGPWHVVYRRTDHMGQRSQPVVHNCRGKRVGSRVPDAVLMAKSPELLELVAALADRVEMQALQIASALELSRVVYPPVLDDARKILAVLACNGVSP